MIVLGLIFVIVASEPLTYAQAQQKHGGFKRIEVSCSEELTKTNKMKTLIECLGFCLTLDDCEAVDFVGKECTTLTNLTCCNGPNHTAWVKKRLISNLEENKNSSK